MCALRLSARRPTPRGVMDTAASRGARRCGRPRPGGPVGQRHAAQTRPLERRGERPAQCHDCSRGACARESRGRRQTNGAAGLTACGEISRMLGSRLPRGSRTGGLVPGVAQRGGYLSGWPIGGAGAVAADMPLDWLERVACADGWQASGRPATLLAGWSARASRVLGWSARLVACGW
jgi:hypothetical protein